MLYQLKLSPVIRAALTQTVRVQMALLHHAATRAALDEGSCAAYLDGIATFAGRGAGIARWIWNGEKRRQPLERFAATATPGTAKADWVTILDGETEALLTGPPGSLTLVDEGVAWQKHAGAFLRHFYDDLSADGGLAASVVGAAKKFTRHDFLSEFGRVNEGVYVCATCDEARVGTRRKGRLVADIDHFFPRSKYPHLSVHPCNLVPICHSCNSYTKGDTDPLHDADAGRCVPADRVLPYHSRGLSELTYLAVDLDRWRSRDEPFTLHPREPDTATDRWIRGVARVVEIPGRWNQAEVVDEIGETAFRRLGQFLRARAEAGDDDGGLLAKLDEFLGVLEGENLRRDPLTFPIHWLMAHLADAARVPPPGGAPLLDEIRQWTAPPASRSEYQRRGADLRRVLEP